MGRGLVLLDHYKSRFFVILLSSKPPGDPHQNCTQFGDGRNGGLIVKRPWSNFVRQHKQ
jgi:hypothetical protein